MIKRTLLIIALVLLTVTGETQGQGSRDSINLGGTELRVGMPEGTVMQSLAVDYDVHQTTLQTGVSLLTVTEKGKPQILIATVGFRNGKLEAANKLWTVTEPNTEAAYANAIYGAVSSFEREGRTQCTIQSAQGQEPTMSMEFKTVFIVCGQKFLTLSIINQNKQPQESATVSETLGIVNEGAPPYVAPTVKPNSQH